MRRGTVLITTAITLLKEDRMSKTTAGILRNQITTTMRLVAPTTVRVVRVSTITRVAPTTVRVVRASTVILMTMMRIASTTVRVVRVSTVRIAPTTV